MFGFYWDTRAQRGLRTGLIAMIAVILGAVPSKASLLQRRHHAVKIEKFQQGRWRLVISLNAFSGGNACHLYERKGITLYQMDAVGFRFAKSWDVSNAVYKVDGAAPRRTRDDLPELISRNAPVDRGPPDHSAQGIVWIPYEALTTSKVVTIQARPNRAPRIRTLDGLAKLHDLAIEHGCSSQHSFVE